MEQPNNKIGRVRVSRMANGKKPADMKLEGFKNIVCLTKSTAYGDLGPYDLWDDKGRCMENIFQFSKVYHKVPASKQVKSRFDQTVVWEWPEETHIVMTNSETKEWTLTPEYFQWRFTEMKAKEAIRYPVGFNHRHECVCSFSENEDGTINPKALDYIESRKVIYIPVYTKLVKQKQRFHALKAELLKGVNLNIIEVDGPHIESLPYYQEKYGAPADWIQYNSIECTKENMLVMLNDPKHPFGHGYVLGLALQDIALV